MSESKQSEGLLATAERLIERARAAGADQADAVVVRRRSRSASVRNGQVENTESSESDDFSLRVFVGQKVATVQAGQGADEEALATRAVAMARVSPEDPHACLADAERLAKTWPDLDLFDPTEPPAESLVDAAMAAEAAALGVSGVASSIGAGAGTGLFGMVLATSHGFSGAFERSGFSTSVSVIAGEGVKMERDYDFDSRVFLADLDDATTIGRRAGERTVAKVNPRKVKTASNVTVVFDPRVARGFIGHLVSAINGASVARKTSFLRDMMGKQVAIKGLTLVDDPFVLRGSGSRPFDGEGVSEGPLTMVEDGVLQQWYLNTSVARELGLKSNGRSGRGAPSSSNVIVNPGPQTAKELIASVGNGFYVTELIGQGVNAITGEYSRGASGFWIENGELTFAVSEVTIASNLKDMFKRMVLANDIDLKYSVAAPTIAVEGMTLAGD